MSMLHHALAVVHRWWVSAVNVVCSRQFCKATLLQHAVLSQPATVCQFVHLSVLGDLVLDQKVEAI